MAISTDPNDVHFGLEADVSSPNFGLPEHAEPSTTQKIISGLGEGLGVIQKAQQAVLNPTSFLTDKLVPESVNRFMRSGLISSQALEPVTKVALAPLKGLANIAFGSEATKEPFDTAGKAISELASSQTSPENLAIIAGTAGAGALESTLAKRAPGLSETFFGVKPKPEVAPEAPPQTPGAPMTDTVTQPTEKGQETAQAGTTPTESTYHQEPIQGQEIRPTEEVNQNAIQEPSAGEVLQRQPQEAGTTGGERPGVEQGVQGEATPQASTQEVATVPTEQPKIVGAAIQDIDTGKTFTGPSHPQIYDKFPQIKGDPGEAFTGEGWNTGGNYIDGFVDQNGKFYDREEAGALHGLTNEASMGELEAVAGKISDKAPYKIVNPPKESTPVSEPNVATTADIKPEESATAEPLPKTGEVVPSENVQPGEFQEPGYTAVPTEESATTQKPSKIGQSIETKAVEAKLTKGFAETAGYDPITIADQSRRATSFVKESPVDARAVLRGEAPLPEGLRGTSLITAMEEDLLRKPDHQLAYELANSPLTTATSVAAQEMRLMSERVPDSLTAKFHEIQEARRAGSKLRGETKEQVFQEINKEVIRQSSKRPTWEAFVQEITC